MRGTNSNEILGLSQIVTWFSQALDFHLFGKRADLPDVELLIEANGLCPLQGVDKMELFKDADGDHAFRLDLKKPKEPGTTSREFDPPSVIALQTLGLARCRFSIEPHSFGNDKYYMRGHFSGGDDHRRFDVRRFVADASKGQKVKELNGYHSLQRKHLSLEAGRGGPSFDAAAAFAVERLDELLEISEENSSVHIDLQRFTDLINLARMVLRYVPLGSR